MTCQHCFKHFATDCDLCEECAFQARLMRQIYGDNFEDLRPGANIRHLGELISYRTLAMFGAAILTGAALTFLIFFRLRRDL